MRGNMSKKAAAACLALLIVTGAMPMQPIAEMTQSVMLTAHAESEQTEGSATLDEETLTLRGYVSKEQVWAAVEKANADSEPSETVTYVVAEKGTALPEDCSCLFYGFGDATSIDLTKADTSNVTDMCCMFTGCESLQTLGLSSFDTSNVTNMSSMFSDCVSLQTLDLSSFDTSKVANMFAMFKSCTSLQTLDLSSFDTSNVSTMFAMFKKCTSLQTLDLSSFDTSKVTNMSGMFADCASLQPLDLSSFDTSKVTNMGGMFDGCENLLTLDLSSFVTSKVTNMCNMFDGCFKLSEIIVGDGWKIGDETTSDDMFAGCKVCPDDGATDKTNAYVGEGGYLSSTAVLNGETLTLRGHVSKKQLWAAVGKANEYSELYEKVTSVVAEEGTVLPADCSSLFMYFRAATRIDLTKADTSKVTDMRSMFYYCYSLETLDLSSFDTSNVTDMRFMFYECKSLETLCLSSFDTSNVTYMRNMFYDCAKLQTLGLSSFDTSKVTDMNNMFYGCKSLSEIIAGDGWNTEAADYSTDMFFGCTALLEKYNATETDKSKAYVGEDGYLSSTAVLDGETLTLRGHVSKKQVQAIDPKAVKSVVAAEGAKLPADSSELFKDLTSCTSIDLSKAVTAEDTIVSGMFDGCTALCSLTLGAGFGITGEMLLPQSGGWYPADSNITPVSGTGDYAVIAAKDAAAGYHTQKCGDACYWTYDDATGTLTISGTGEMQDYDPESIPWSKEATKLVVQSGVTSIGEYAFCECKALQEVTLPAGVTSIGNGAFQRCTALQEVTLPASVTSIVEGAFFECTALTAITIPAGVTEIGSDAFVGCTALTAITVDAENRNYTDKDGVLFTKDGKTLITYPAGRKAEQYTVPAGTEKIEDLAFRFCPCSELDLTDGVTELGRLSLLDHSAVKRIIIPATVTKADHVALYCVNELLQTVTVQYVGTEAQWKALGIDLPDTATLVCNYRESGDYTLSCEDAVWDGTEQKPAVTILLDGKKIDSKKCELIYSDNIEPGTATITINVGVDVAGRKAKQLTQNFKIDKAKLSPTLMLDDWTYGETPAKEVLTGNLENAEVTYTYWRGTEKLPGKPTEAGTYSVTAHLAETAHYDEATVSAAFTIVPADAAVTAVPTANELTYSGKAQALVKAGTAVGGELLYSLDGKTFSKAIPTETNAGEYTVYYKVEPDQNHIGTEVDSVKVKIARADASVTAVPTANELTYSGKAQALVKAGTAVGGELLYSLDGKTFSKTIPTGTNAGEYTVYYKVEPDKNHIGTEADSVKVKIAPQKITITADDQKSDYGKTLNKLTYKVTSGTIFEGDDLGIELTCEADANTSGTKPIVVTCKKNTNYEVTIANGTYTVSEAPATTTATESTTTTSGTATTTSGTTTTAKSTTTAATEATTITEAATTETTEAATTTEETINTTEATTSIEEKINTTEATTTAEEATSTTEATTTVEEATSTTEATAATEEPTSTTEATAVTEEATNTTEATTTAEAATNTTTAASTTDTTAGTTEASSTEAAATATSAIAATEASTTTEGETTTTTEVATTTEATTTTTAGTTVASSSEATTTATSATAQPAAETTQPVKPPVAPPKAEIPEDADTIEAKSDPEQKKLEAAVSVEDIKEEKWLVFKSADSTTVALDAEAASALAAIMKQTGCEEITLNVSFAQDTSEMTPEAAVRVEEAMRRGAMVFDVSFVDPATGKNVPFNTNNNGKAVVEIPMTQEMLRGFGSDMTAVYVDHTGSIEYLDTWYDPASGKLTFTTTHFSTFMVTEDERPVDMTVKPDGWFASLGDFEAMARKDYAKKSENADVTAKTEATADGTVHVTIADQNGEVLDVYTIDPKTGTGTNQENEEVNLPQTGVTSKSTAAAVGGALAMIAAGFWTAVRSLRKKKDE